MRALLAGALIAFPAFPAQARVLDLHAEIRVAKSGELTVVERMTLSPRDKAPQFEPEVPPGARVVQVIRSRNLYQVTYRASGRIASSGELDALHWNLKGAERMTAEVLLPSSVPAREIKLAASGGDFRSFVGDGRAAFRAEQPIAIVVRFPKGVVDRPPPDYFSAALLAGLLGFSAWVLLRIRKLALAA